MNNFRVKGCLVTLVPCTVWIIENTKTFARVSMFQIKKLIKIMMNPKVMRGWNVISDELQKISLFIFDRRIKYIEVHNL